MQRHLEAVRNTLRNYRDKIDSLRSSLTSCGVDVSRLVDYPFGVQSTPNPDNLADTVAQIVELERELHGLTEETLDIINWLRDADMRKVLALRYIDDVEVSEIAKIMGYSMRHMYRLCNGALDRLSEMKIN